MLCVGGRDIDELDSIMFSKSKVLSICMSNERPQWGI